jgi:hypothetical protein
VHFLFPDQLLEGQSFEASACRIGCVELLLRHYFFG